MFLIIRPTFFLLPFLLLSNGPLALEAAQYKCGDIMFDPADSSNRCQDTRGASAIGQPALKDMLCVKDPSFGCEQYTDTMGRREFFCCPQLCDDAAKTRINLQTTPRCTRDVCNSDMTKVCKHVSNGDDYCCPSSSGAGAGTAGGAGGGGTMTTRNPSSGACVDFRSDCAAKADLCIVEFAYERMYRDCPKTCNVCGDCKDLGTDCPDRKRDGYCERAVYHDLMSWQCPMSCNRCNNRRPPRGDPMAANRG